MPLSKIPQKACDEMEKKKVPAEVGLWVAPVYLLDKFVFISFTHTKKLECSQISCSDLQCVKMWGLRRNTWTCCQNYRTENVLLTLVARTQSL